VHRACRREDVVETQRVLEAARVTGLRD